MKVEVTYRGALPELLGRSSETVEARTVSGHNGAHQKFVPEKGIPRRQSGC